MDFSEEARRGSKAEPRLEIDRASKSGSADSESINSDAGTSRRQSITYYLTYLACLPTHLQQPSLCDYFLRRSVHFLFLA
jgi:hypothetical protein